MKSDERKNFPETTCTKEKYRRIIRITMKGEMAIEQWLLGYLAVAAIWDIWTGKIPNWYILTGLLAGYLFHIYWEGLHGIVICTMYLILPIILFVVLFLIHALGAGDIKLFSVVAVITNMQVLFNTIIGSFILGAVYALIKMLYQKSLWSSLWHFRDYLQQVFWERRIEPYQRAAAGDEQTMHFAAAIFGGYIMTLGVLL